jgi:hypothetical protein
MLGCPWKVGDFLLILLVLLAHLGGACSPRRRALRQRHGARADTAVTFGHHRHASTWPPLRPPSLNQL